MICLVYSSTSAYALAVSMLTSSSAIFSEKYLCDLDARLAMHRDEWRPADRLRKRT